MPASDPNAPRLPTPRSRPARSGSGLRAFSDALALRLAGHWSAAAIAPFDYGPASADVKDRLWDHGHVEWALQDFIQEEAAVLDGPAKENFVVIPRPLRRGKFLVAALAPPGIDGTLRAEHAPHGIAVSDDPARAAAAVQRRLLPRYRHAVETVRAPALRQARLLAQQALDDWDAVSDSYCDDQGFPLDDDAYATRQAQRDQDAWDAFETFLFHGPAALEEAQATLDALGPLPPDADRWAYRLRALKEALAEGIGIRNAWEPHLLARVARHDDPDRQRAFNDGLDARNAEGWPAVTAFLDHAPVLDIIAEAPRLRASAEAARITAARARSSAKAPGTAAAPTPAPAPQAPPAEHRTR
jgi:hypothetical protein